MAFKPILSKVIYIEEIDKVVVTVDYTDGEQDFTRTYEFNPDDKREDIQARLMEEKQLFDKPQPQLVREIEALIGTDLTIAAVPTDPEVEPIQ